MPNVRGDVAALLDPTQTSISDAYRYDPFGVTLASLGTSINPYRFQGRLLESTSGQYDFGSRQYDPALASFTSLDSVLGQAANPISLNRFLYALANPESMIDPDGHAACHNVDGCADSAAAAKVEGLRAAAASADLAALAAYNAADRAEDEANIAQDRANQPCKLAEADVCASWRHSLQAAANSAHLAAQTASANYTAAQKRATAAHLALTRGLAAQLAINRRNTVNAPPRPAYDSPSESRIQPPAMSCTRGVYGQRVCDNGKSHPLDLVGAVKGVVGGVGDAWAMTGGKVVNLVAEHPVESVGIALGVVSVVSGVGAVAAAVGVVVPAAAGLTLGLVSAGAGIAAGMLDLTQCHLDQIGGACVNGVLGVAAGALGFAPAAVRLAGQVAGSLGAATADGLATTGVVAAIGTTIVDVFRAIFGGD